MKKSYFIGLSSFCLILLLSSFTMSDAPTRQKMMAFLGLEPYLPELPYSYKVKIPDYLVDGYFWVEQNQSYIENGISDKKATLGRVLFYDKILSADNKVSCGSCHQQAHGFADNKPFSEGVFGQQTFRNAPNINDLFWKLDYEPANIPLFWDARANNLHEMLLMPIINAQEMGMYEIGIPNKLENTTYYPALFEDAFGEPGIDVEKLKEALKHFVRSMNTFDSKYDRVKNNDDEFTAAEAAGEQVFNTHCNTCHTAPLFSVFTPILNGFPIGSDLGFGALSELPADSGKFKSPSLRNVMATAPYMHNGSFSTLEEVLQFYSDEIEFPFEVYYGSTGQPIDGSFNMTDDEIQNLTAFLGTLTSNNLLTHPKWSDPFVEPSSIKYSVLPNQIDVFPNPFSKSTTINLENPNAETFKIRIVSLNGQVMKEFTSNGKSVDLERGNLVDGAYMLEISKENQMKTVRLIVQ